MLFWIREELDIELETDFLELDKTCYSGLDKLAIEFCKQIILELDQT